MAPVCPGLLIWDKAPSGRGQGKCRPLIIAMRRIDYLQGRPVITIGCSTDIDEPLNDDEIRLPHDPNGNCLTQLRRPTIAVCNWIEKFPPKTRFETGGMVTGTLLHEIFRKAGITVPPER